MAYLKLPSGTFVCPICGETSPHNHDDLRRAATTLICQLNGGGMAYGIDILTRALELLVRETREKALRGADAPAAGEEK